MASSGIIGSCTGLPSWLVVFRATNHPLQNRTQQRLRHSAVQAGRPIHPAIPPPTMAPSPITCRPSAAPHHAAAPHPHAAHCRQSGAGPWPGAIAAQEGGATAGGSRAARAGGSRRIRGRRHMPGQPGPWKVQWGRGEVRGCEAGHGAWQPGHREERHDSLGGTLTAIRDWFRDYKIPDGKPANRFGLGNKPASKEYALKVIEETNESWEKLVKRNIPAGELSLA